MDLVTKVEAAFDATLPEEEWMDDSSRAAAFEKVAAVQNLIGHPSEWTDYGDLLLAPSKLVTNVMQIRTWGACRSMREYGQPVDKDTWSMGPQTVNAYYSPPRNQMVSCGRRGQPCEV